MSNIENTLACPICSETELEDVFPDYHGRCITSQFFHLDEVTICNRICKRCGFIFDGKGIRDREEAIYNAEVWKPVHHPLVYSEKKKPSPRHKQTLDCYLSLKELPATGKMLDFGAGTGGFLRCFQEVFPEWEVSAFEPGEGYNELVATVELKEAYNLPFHKVHIDEQFDLITVNSVLEHVANPLLALQWIKERLKPDGVLLMRHPDFAKLPGDLLNPIHISKLTIPYTKALCMHAGFDVFAEETLTVMFYLALTHGEVCSLPNEFESSFSIVQDCTNITKSTLGAVEKAIDSSRKRNGKAAVFGVSTIAKMSPILLDSKESIVCFVDENESLKGKSIEGIPVVTPDKIKELQVTDLAIATSPIYWSVIAEKMSQYNVNIHIPKVKNG